jgi:hypothetical protein
MVDRYTKAILTIIAVALAVIAAENEVKIARADRECGSSERDACYVRTDSGGITPITLSVKVR